MNEAVRKDLTRSAKNFIEIVYPEIKQWFGNGQLVPVEAVTEIEMAKMLDMNSGIDAWYVETENGIRGIGSRVQYDTDYSSFTIRKKRVGGTRTEYEKLSNAIENEWLYPHWFCQAFIDGEYLSNAGLCTTIDLIEFIKNGTLDKDYFINSCSNAEFFVVYWKHFRNKYDINILRETKYNRPSRFAGAKP